MHRRSSNTPTCGASRTGTAGRTLDDCMETTSLSWTFHGFISPVGPYFQLKRSGAQSKSKTRHMQEEVGEEPTLGERGRLQVAGLAHQWRGVGLTEKRHAGLQSRDHLNFCLKLVKKYGVTASYWRGGGISGISDNITSFILSTGEATRTYCTNINVTE